MTHRTLAKITTFESLYGYAPPLIKDYVVTNFKMPAMKSYLVTSDEILHLFKNHLEETWNQIKQQVNMNITNHDFEVRD